MKQHGDEHWSGHREITREAVDLLFEELAGPDGQLRGIDREQYFGALDKAQARQDRPLSVGLIHNHGNSGRSFPYAGLGPTMHSAWANPETQRLHFMADPYRNGPENLRTNATYLMNELQAAHRVSTSSLRTSLRTEMPRLGAAAHALQDSYSGAHTWREDSVYSGDPLAPIQWFHVFTPAHSIGLKDNRNTHADEFDQPPTRSGSVRAAVEATYRMLTAHEQSQGADVDRAGLTMWRLVGPLMRGSAAGVGVNLAPDHHWQAERDRRLALEQGDAASWRESSAC